MKTIDLHVHSNYSDGTCNVEQLVELALQKNLAAFALTDHDTLAGIEPAMEFMKGKDLPLEIIPGTELSVDYMGHDIHMVGLFLDSANKELLQTTAEFVARRDRRNDQMVANLQKAGIPITMEALKEGNPDTVVTRAHFARFLITNHVVKDSKEAFQKYLGEDCPYYVPRYRIPAEKGIELIRNAHGVPVLAHPIHYKFAPDQLRTMVRTFKEAGLVGIEVKYSNHSRQDEVFVSHLAKEFDLLPSGGSDFHGSNKPAIDLGCGRGNLSIPYEYLTSLAQVVHYPLKAQ